MPAIAICYVTFNYTGQGQEYASGDIDHRGMMSQSVVLECQQGSQVWLEASANECFVHGNIDERESVFGGFILQRL